MNKGDKVLLGNKVEGEQIRLAVIKFNLEQQSNQKLSLRQPTHFIRHNFMVNKKFGWVEKLKKKKTFASLGRPGGPCVRDPEDSGHGAPTHLPLHHMAADTTIP